MATVMKDIVNWLKQWYYTESEVDTFIGGLQSQINNKADSSTVSALDTTVQGKADKTGGVAQVTDSNSANYTNIGSLSANATQQTINNAINTKIGTLMNVDWIIVVTTLPSASSSTMGKLYLVPLSTTDTNNNFAEYVTIKDTTVNPVQYQWEKLGEINGSGLSVDWTDITNNPFSNASPSDYATSGHNHNQITNDGKITSSAVTVASDDNIVITDYSDSSKIKRVANLLASHIKDGTAHSNIGSSANDTQATINTKIDTELGNRISKSSTVGLVKNDGTIDTNSYVSDVSGKADKTGALGTTITLVDKGETNEGCIIFNTIS